MNKILLNFSEPILDFVVEESANRANAVIKPGRDSLALIVSRWLQASRSIEPIKCLDWAITLWHGTSLEVDASDYDEIEKNLKADTQFPRILIGQILRAMRQSKEQAEAGKAKA